MPDPTHLLSTAYLSVHRLIGALMLIVSSQLILGITQTAVAETFTPSTTSELMAAFAQAGVNQEDDIVDLGDQTFELTEELVLEPDEGYGLLLREGALVRPDVTGMYRLLNLRAVPYFVEDDGKPVVIDGVLFKNGLYHETDLVDGSGGGGALLSHRKTVINNSRFVNNEVTANSAGGAIKHSKSLDISKVLFVNNKAIVGGKSERAQGGAISVDTGASLFVAHSYFLGNSAGEGGAIYASHKVTNLSITRSAFDGNTAQSLGGAVWSNVGDGDVRISNSSFIANRAPLGGGAFYTQSLFASVTLVHLTVWGNVSDAGYGGGIRAMVPRDGSKIVLRNSILANNVGGNCMGTNGEILSFRTSSYNLLDDENCGQEGITLHTGVASVFSGKFEYYGGSIPSLPIAKSGQAGNLIPRDLCLDYDARDVPRLDNTDLRDDYCDAGAFEYVPLQQIDEDGDEVRNRDDNCLSISNPLQSDIDDDGVGDSCDQRDDRDSDGDVVLNFIDNCPTVSNFLQLDINQNGIGDKCEQRTVDIAVAPVNQPSAR